MKILLTAVNAKYIHANLAVYSLAAAAKPVGADIQIAEYTINHQKEDILKGIYKERADVAAFSCYIWNIEFVLSIAARLKQVAPQTKIWLGGPEVSYDAADVLAKHPEIDGVICGEGEEAFTKLCEIYVNLEKEKKCGKASGVRIDRKDVYQTAAEAFSHIAGFTYRNGEGKICVNPITSQADMDSLPFVYDYPALFENKIIYYESSRGCPFSCSYCLSSIDKRVRFKSTALVCAELQKLIDARVPQVKFVDRTFNCRHAHTMEIWQYIKEHDNGVTNFHFEITADLLGDEEIALLNTMRPGLVQLEIGVQSTNQKTLEEIRRVMDFGQLSDVVTKIAAGKNVHQHLDLIAGLPFEDLESFRKSFNDVYALAPQQLQLGFLKVLKGSWMYENQAAYDLVYTKEPPYEVLSTKWLSFDDVLYLKGIEAVVEVFYNSRQFEKTLPYLERFFETPFDFYGALAAYYEKHGLNEMSHKRLARYEHLLSFSKEIGADEGLTAALLIYDLYARENLKSRPAWAPSDEKKEAAAAFFSDREALMAYMPRSEGMSYRQVRYETHLEYFEYDMEAAWTRGEAIRQEYKVLFDYGQRDALTYEAAAIHIRE